MTLALARRIWWEQRVRFPLVAGFSLLWGFLLILFYTYADAPQRDLGPDELQAAFSLLGLDPLAAWVGIGQQHPLFLAASFVFVVEMGIRSVAGELEGGTLELVLTRPVSRSRWFVSYLSALVPGTLVIAFAYVAGCLLAYAIFDPSPGELSVGPLLRMGAYTALLFAAVASYSLLCSALSSERGRALGWALGLTIAMYAWNFLASLVETLQPFARISIWSYYVPSPVADGGPFPWLDAAVLLGVATVCAGAAWAVFVRRNLA